MSLYFTLASGCKVHFGALEAVVGALGTTATIIIGVLAWWATRAAARAATDAASIAKQQREDSDAFRQAQGRILEQMLYEEILYLPMKADGAYRALDAAIDWQQGCTIRNGRALDVALTNSQEVWLPVTEANQDRIHYLRPEFGEVLAQLLAANRALNAKASKMASHVRPPDRNFIGSNHQPSYAGDNTDFVSLRRTVDRISEMSILFASSFSSTITLREVTTLGHIRP